MTDISAIGPKGLNVLGAKGLSFNHFVHRMAMETATTGKPDKPQVTMVIYKHDLYD